MMELPSFFQGGGRLKSALEDFKPGWLGARQANIDGINAPLFKKFRRGILNSNSKS